MEIVGALVRVCVGMAHCDKKRHRVYRGLKKIEAMIIKSIDLLWVSFLLHYDDDKKINEKLFSEMQSKGIANIAQTTAFRNYNLFCHVCEDAYNDGFLTKDSGMADCERVFYLLGLNRFCSEWGCIEPCINLFFSLEEFLLLDKKSKISYLKDMFSLCNGFSEEGRIPIVYTILGFLINQDLLLEDKEFSKEITNIVNMITEEQLSTTALISAIPFQF